MKMTAFENPFADLPTQASEPPTFYPSALDSIKRADKQTLKGSCGRTQSMESAAKKVAARRAKVPNGLKTPTPTA